MSERTQPWGRRSSEVAFVAGAVAPGEKMLLSWPPTPGVATSPRIPVAPAARRCTRCRRSVRRYAERLRGRPRPVLHACRAAGRLPSVRHLAGRFQSRFCPPFDSRLLLRRSSMPSPGADLRDVHATTIRRRRRRSGRDAPRSASSIQRLEVAASSCSASLLNVSQRHSISRKLVRRCSYAEALHRAQSRSSRASGAHHCTPGGAARHPAIPECKQRWAALRDLTYPITPAASR